jgi:putative aldouronate transport system permease protein
MEYRSRSYTIFKGFNIVLMLLVAALMLFPYLHISAKALNDATDTRMGGLTVYPRKFSTASIKAMLKNEQNIAAFQVSVLKVAVGTIIALSVQFSAAYALKNKRLPGRTFLLTYLLVPMFIGAGIIPNYILFSKIGLLNNFLVYVIPGSFSFYNMIIIRTYMQGAVPESLEESAMMDGANELFIFSRIVLPLCVPIVATIALWHSVNEWNGWVDTLYYVTDKSLHTLQYRLQLMVREAQSITRAIQKAIEQGDNVEAFRASIKYTPESMVAAQIVITSIPIVVMYPFLQKYFVSGIRLGSVKG